MPFLGHSMDSRNDVFQRLKPVCVALSQAALTSGTAKVDTGETTNRLEDLQRCLTAVIAQQNSLDVKLADYAFFPLSQILKNSQSLSVRSLELTFQCLTILIAQGWRARIQPQLAAQIVILCTLMADKKHTGLPASETTSELQCSVFCTLKALFGVLDPASAARQELVKESNIPQLGQTISTTLDGTTDGLSVDCQIAATEALSLLIENVATLDIKAGFLPGIVSKLTKALTPQTKQRRHHKVLIEALKILRSLFVAILASDPTARERKISVEASSKSSFSNVIDDKWLETAAKQLKPAIINILRLRSHDRQDVKDALAQLCFVVLKDCEKTLANCAPDALQTLLVLASEDGQDSIAFRLEMALVAVPRLSSLLQDTLRDWLLSLPNQMQASDEQAKPQRLKQIGIAHSILVTSGADTSLVDGMVSDALRDSVVITLQSSGEAFNSGSNVQPIQALDIAVNDQKTANLAFRMPLVKHRGQTDVMIAIKRFIQSMSTTTSSTTFASSLTRTFRHSQGEMQLATYWLLLEHTQAMLNARTDIEGLITFEVGSSLVLEEAVEDVYSFALDVLTGSSQSSMDPQFQSLALRALALRAQASGEDFRYELIDALYPVLHTLATPEEQLQQDSIVTLNVFAWSCGYPTVKDLIVDNVDYLTNMVALRLNAFDVSPQAPQVLLMMVRLAGPSLLPYLEDTIGSIFAALEDYHGYPLLVELLFRVLAVIAEEGAKAPRLAITPQRQIAMREAREDRWTPLPLSELVEYLKDMASDDAEWRQTESKKGKSHPQRPWAGDEEDQPDDTSHEDGDESDEAAAGNEERQVDEPDPKPPAPKTYNLLLKISELTQHFLPSASASLRTSLLALIKTTVPAIAQHENAFLPLINTLWPEIVSRLDDDESHVVAAALEIIALLCEYAGDFMRSRVLQIWPALVDIHRATLVEILQLDQPQHGNQSSTARLVPAAVSLHKAIARMKSDSIDYTNTATKLMWRSLVLAIISAVRYVSVPPDHFDSALDMMEPCIEEPDVQEAFQKQNADAVWLLRVRNGAVPLPSIPGCLDAAQNCRLASFHVQ